MSNDRSAFRIGGVILAGGKSSRMGGGDKCLLPLDGVPMLGSVIERLSPQVEAMVLNANGDPTRFEHFSLDVVPDSIEGFAGPLAGILAGMNWALSSETPLTHVVSVAADTPFFPHDLVSGLVAAAGDPAAIALARSGGRGHPVFGLWPLALRETLQDFLEKGATLKVRAFADRHAFFFADFPVNDGIDPFFNINTSEDLARAETFLADGQS